MKSTANKQPVNAGTMIGLLPDFSWHTKTDFCYFYIFKSLSSVVFYIFFLPCSQFQVKEEVRKALNSEAERKGGFLPETCLSCIIKVNGKKRSGHELPEMSRKACFWPIAAEFLSLPAKTFSWHAFGGWCDCDCVFLTMFSTKKFLFKSMNVKVKVSRRYRMFLN